MPDAGDHGAIGGGGDGGRRRIVAPAILLEGVTGLSMLLKVYLLRVLPLLPQME